MAADVLGTPMREHREYADLRGMRFECSHSPIERLAVVGGLAPAPCCNESDIVLAAPLLRVPITLIYDLRVAGKPDVATNGS